MNISGIVITRDEESNIKSCLATLNFVDEVIVVDNNSKDKTVEIAKTLGAHVYQISGLDFSYLRNVGKEKAKGTWLFYIDADERVSDALAAEIKNTISHSNDISAYSVTRENYYLGKLWPKKEKIVRLVKKEALIGWQGILHESPIVAGKTGQLISSLLHYTHSNLSSMLAKTNAWSEIEAQLRFKSNHPKMSWWRFFRVMTSSFCRSYFQDGGWKVGTMGLVESIYQSFSMFITYAKLWEKQNQKIPPQRGPFQRREIPQMAGH